MYTLVEMSRAVKSLLESALEYLCIGFFEPLLVTQDKGVQKTGYPEVGENETCGSSVNTRAN